MNPVLDRLRTQRAEQMAAMDAVLSQVTDDRDLVDAEKSLLTATQQRLSEIDAQIKPLADYEDMRAAHEAASANLPQPRGDRVAVQPRRADGNDRAPQYRSAGEFLVDLLRARGIADRNVIDAAAAARIQARAVADQKTTDTTGILPTPIVGQVVNLIDANRPFISSLGGAKALSGIPGATFTRPSITQHVLVGQQVPAGGAGEKTQLPSQKMTITPISFAKNTYGGTVDISRQDIDWTSHSAWDILVRDLANVYARQTESATAAGFKAAATATPVVVATNDLKGWTLALYTAAMHSYQGGFMMPDRIWCSLDVWAALGSLVDVARVVLPSDASTGAPDTPLDSFDIGAASLANFRGDMLGVPRIVVPTFAAGTCIVGPSALFEVYEEVIGLLSVIEPSILGVQVAYGGYLASGSLAAPAFIPLTPPAGMPTMAEVDGPPADEEADEKPPAKNAK
ncbi:MAG TPA: phage major capsid protein [Acidimicrobiales bacterium]